jgi:hypothetical protein
MVVGFTTTYAISAYHHSRCEFESRLGEVYSIQHSVIKFVIDGSVVFSWYSGFLHQKTNRHHIVEILLKVALNTITLTPYVFLSSFETILTSIEKSTYSLNTRWKIKTKLELFYNLIKNRKNKGKINVPNDSPGAGTSIKGGRVKLVLWTQLRNVLTRT